jgi:hypothetical protein
MPARLQSHPGWTPLSGSIQIDAAYAIAHTQGTLLEGPDGRFLGAGKGVTGQGFGLISNNGAGLVSNNGSGIISDNGGNIIANNGSSVVAQNGGRIANTGPYRLAGANVALAPGTALRAAGMLITASSLRTHTPLAVGQDANGHDVFAIYSNLAGHYTVYIAPSEANNVLVTTQVPEAHDRRLTYPVILAVNTGAHSLDEQSATVTKLLRAILINRMIGYIRLESPSSLGGASDSSVGTLLGPFFSRVQDAAKRSHTATLSTEQATALCESMADEALAEAKLEEAKILPGGKWNRSPDESAYIGLTSVLNDIAAHAGKTLASDPKSLDDLIGQFEALKAKKRASDPFVAATPDIAFTIAKPADVEDFVARGLYGLGGTEMETLFTVLLQQLGFADPEEVHDHFNAAANGFAIASALALAGNESLQARLIADVLASSKPLSAPAQGRTGL